jgi:hypothetical protein
MRHEIEDFRISFHIREGVQLETGFHREVEMLSTMTHDPKFDVAGNASTTTSK